MTTIEATLASKTGLKTELESLLRWAPINRIEAKRMSECQKGAEHPDWDVIVTEVQKNEGVE